MGQLSKDKEDLKLGALFFSFSSPPWAQFGLGDKIDKI
jgi:hypothetical protein